MISIIVSLGDYGSRIELSTIWIPSRPISDKDYTMIRILRSIYFGSLSINFKLFDIIQFRFNQICCNDTDSYKDFGSIKSIKRWFESNFRQNLGLSWFNHLSFNTCSTYFIWDTNYILMSVKNGFEIWFQFSVGNPLDLSLLKQISKFFFVLDLLAWNVNFWSETAS